MSQPTVNLLILGASGDLTRRLLLPGLGTLLKAEPERRVRILGAAANDLSSEEWRLRLMSSFADSGCSDRAATRLAENSSYQQVDLTNGEAVKALVDQLGDGPSVIYFALPPSVTESVLHVLDEVGGVPSNVRLGLEKPFGRDLESAIALNELLHRIADESQIFRVDHFLGRSGVLNLLGFRFANRVFSPVWNASHVEAVDIIFDESLALEGRASYYDNAGALIDMIQSHLLLMLAITAMEDLSRLDERELRDLITHTLRAVTLWDEPAKSSLRARYSTGVVEGKQVPAYVDEPGVDPAKETETLAEVTVRINNERWAGVPFRLRSGKALGKNDRRIVMHFKPVGHVPTGFGSTPGPNKLTIALSPEQLLLDITTNGSGDKFELEGARMTATMGESSVRPYGEILAHIMDGDPLLSVRGDTAEELWRILTPVVEAWRAGEVPMDEYPAGTRGPEQWPNIH